MLSASCPSLSFLTRPSAPGTMGSQAARVSCRDQSARGGTDGTPGISSPGTQCPSSAPSCEAGRTRTAAPATPSPGSGSWTLTPSIVRRPELFIWGEDVGECSWSTAMAWIQCFLLQKVFLDLPLAHSLDSEIWLLPRLRKGFCPSWNKFPALQYPLPSPSYLHVVPGSVRLSSSSGRREERFESELHLQGLHPGPEERVRLSQGSWRRGSGEKLPFCSILALYPTGSFALSRTLLSVTLYLSPSLLP
ncbi:uncharacterized protein LOC117032546 [Rhinolophus ferrumequinum]|uniref:uncharacterized protein LOC117032546 n=1 Tax=Rhinolophus ferrumequinum TaxID=59479 RepID=UPI00140F7B4B|nr:uncharacterized protein LOC117032546 [Rhinolophus ferrumequinum]